MVACVGTGPDSANLEIRHRFVVVILRHLKLPPRPSCSRKLIPPPAEYGIGGLAVVWPGLHVKIECGAANEVIERKVAACLGIGAALIMRNC